ncbi:glycosyltransferase [Fervidobacterium thailandense]|uniref:Glycosyltransferase 2-like domain-containing protein n=1 Tax=Fervidobacterium thailandense TaxID=1008305 RepID=A0A1E3G2U2_9BACT|nr:glycosyltransferase [Fervidobacterium thailandense]ODN30529.1 hypothetical protein A4H02_04565 [Fervidobacterium thailandense]
MPELVSIVVPVYNVEDYLSRCVESLLRQTYSSIEIILVDDGSTDSSGSICDTFAKIDKRVKVIHKPNGGLSDARNSGLQVARGGFVTFVDGDDVVSEKYVETLLENAQRFEADISICNFRRFHDESELLVRNRTVEPVMKVLNNVDALLELYGPLYVQFTVSWGKLYRRALWEDVRFPVGKLHEDEFTTYKLLWKARKVVYTGEELYFYRQRSGSIMRSFDSKRICDIVGALKERAQFFKENNLKHLNELTEKRLFWTILANLSKISEKETLADGNQIRFLRKELINLVRHTSIRDPLFRLLMFLSVPFHNFVYRAYRVYNNLVLKFGSRNSKVRGLI